MAKKHVGHKPMHEKSEKEEKCCHTEFDPKRVGLAMGILAAFCMGFMAFAALTFGLGGAVVRMIGSALPGYDVSFLGIAMGLFWGFVKGFIIGYLFVLIYNKVDECCC